LDGPSPIPLLLRELGVQLRPDPVTTDGLDIRNGRAFISLEQLPLVDGDTIFLLASSGVEGAALAGFGLLAPLYAAAVLPLLAALLVATRLPATPPR
jgi:ABC-type Fe2+-enterobactin transport system substrate-binding protein